MPKGMFTELMDVANKKQQPPVEREARAIGPTLPPDDLFPDTLEDLSTVGYNSHSYRFTETEIRWMRRFSLRASELFDRKISHNSLVRVLLRLADQEWKTNPDSNRLRDLLSKIRD